MLSHFLHPPLPPPQSWYPGHMTRFSRMLPALLSRTDVVLELRDARLPLTSVNRNFEGKSDCVTKSWREEPPTVMTVCFPTLGDLHVLFGFVPSYS